jgi:TRAP transporter TAXI family solute receptor
MKRYSHGLAVAAIALLSSAAVSAQQAGPSPKICTGSKDGRYFGVGVELVQRLGAAGIVQFGADPKAAVLETAGSVDNLRRLSRGECQFALVQKDALISITQYEPTMRLDVRRVVEIYPEYVHLLCNTSKINGRVTALRANRGKNTIAIGEPGSGVHSTWTAITKIEPRYNRENGPRQLELGGVEALIEVEEGRVDCMLYVAGLNTAFIKELNSSARGKIKLVSFDDKDFLKRGEVDGTPVYSAGEFPTGGNYSRITGWSSPDTITTPATLVVSQAWYAENRRAYSSLLGDLRRWLAERK